MLIYLFMGVITSIMHHTYYYYYHHHLFIFFSSRVFVTHQNLNVFSLTFTWGVYSCYISYGENLYSFNVRLRVLDLKKKKYQPRVF
jgi:hypothetical protein